MTRAFLGIVCGVFCGTVIACGSSSSGSGTGGGGGTGGGAGAGAGTGGSSGSSGGGATGGSVGVGGASGSTGTGGCSTNGVPGASNSPSCQALSDCITTKCASQIAQCYGAGYMSGNYSGGQCQALATCVGGCNCASSCVVGCSSSLDAACQACLVTLDSCTSSMCASEAQQCNGTARDGGTGFPSLDAGFSLDAFTGGGTCTDLRACCAMLSGQTQTQCNMVAGGNNDAICGVALSGFRMAGLCQ